MKKISLKSIKRELLSREQLKRIIGGFEDDGGSGKKGFCMYTCSMTLNGHSYVYDSPYPELKCNTAWDCPSKRCPAGSGSAWASTAKCVN